MSIIYQGQVLKCEKCNYELRDSMTHGIYCPNMSCKKNPYYQEGK